MDEVCAFKDQHGRSWVCTKDAQERIQRMVVPALSQELGGSRSTSLKESKRRQVVAIDVPGEQSVVVKRYPPRRSLWYRLKDRWNTRAALEFWMTQRLRETGVRIPAPWGFAVVRESRGTFESFYVGSRIYGAEPLGPMLESSFAPGDQNSTKLALIDRALFDLNRFHRAGILFRDAHGGNVLVRRAEGPAGQLCWIDVPSALCLATVPQYFRAADYAHFLMSVRHVLDPEELAERIALLPLPPALVEKAIAREWQRRGRSRLKRAFVNSSEYLQESDGEAVVSRRREFSADQLRAAVSQHRQSVAARDQHILRWTEKSCLSRQTIVGQTVVVKEFNGARARQRARQSFRGGVLLAVYDIRTPAALGLKLDSGNSFVIMEAVDEAEPLQFLASRPAAGANHQHRKRRIAAGLRALLEAMRTRNVYHPDLSAKNLLIDAKDRVTLVDWDGLFPRRSWNERRFRRALVQLADLPHSTWSNADRLRFLTWFYPKRHDLCSVARATQGLLRFRQRLQP